MCSLTKTDSMCGRIFKYVWNQKIYSGKHVSVKQRAFDVVPRKACRSSREKRRHPHHNPVDKICSRRRSGVEVTGRVTDGVSMGQLCKSRVVSGRSASSNQNLIRQPDGRAVWIRSRSRTRRWSNDGERTAWHHETEPAIDVKFLRTIAHTAARSALFDRM